MEQISFYISIISFVLVILLWFIFGGTFLLKKAASDSTASDTNKHLPKSWIGLALQGAGFALVWAIRRMPLFSPFIEGQFVLNIVLAVLAVLIAAGSVWLAISAVRELGKQWSLEARLIEDHRLVTTGVYQIVRHPIYTAMLGMLAATALVFSHWLVFLISSVIFLIGTKIRTISEEKLLREAFPKEYEEYAAKVASLIPFVKI